jgi:hypothetical protein
VARLVPERTEPTPPRAVVDVLGHEAVGESGRERDRRSETAQPLGHQARLDEFDLRRRNQHGRVRRNVHIVEQPLSEYLRYQFEWCYTFNVAAGQDVRVLDISSNPAAAPLAACGGFAVLEGIDVARNNYALDGTFLGAVQAPADTAVALTAVAETAWAMAVPFTTWWRDHPQYHRATRAA